MQLQLPLQTQLLLPLLLLLLLPMRLQQRAQQRPLLLQHLQPQLQAAPAARLLSSSRHPQSHLQQQHLTVWASQQAAAMTTQQ
jgi:hypothetical protein